MKKLRQPNGEHRRLLLYKRLPWSQQPPECGPFKVWVHQREDMDALTITLLRNIDGIDCYWKFTHPHSYLQTMIPGAEWRQLQTMARNYNEPFSINMFNAASTTLAQWLLLEWSQQDWEKIVREEWEKRLTREALAGTVTP